MSIIIEAGVGLVLAWLTVKPYKFLIILSMVRIPGLNIVLSAFAFGFLFIGPNARATGLVFLSILCCGTVAEWLDEKVKDKWDWHLGWIFYFVAVCLNVYFCGLIFSGKIEIFLKYLAVR